MSETQQLFTVSVAAELVPVPHTLVKSQVYEPASAFRVLKMISVLEFAALMTEPWPLGPLISAMPFLRQAAVALAYPGAGCTENMASCPQFTVWLVGLVATHGTPVGL